MTTTIRVSEPRELLAYIPYRLGFRPRRSAVVVSLRGGRRRIGLVARVDLDELADRATGPGVAEGLATHLWRDGAEQAVIVVYDEHVRDGARWTADVGDALQHALDPLTTMIGSTQAWAVDEERYYSVDCDDEECCPVAGWPLGDLAATQVSAQMVFAGASIAEHRGSATEVVPAPKEARYNVRRVARRWAARRAGLSSAGTDRSSGAWVEELRPWYRESLRSWQAALEAVGRHEAVPPRVLGRIDAALHDNYLRDLIVASAVMGPERVTDALDEPEPHVRGRVNEAFDALFDPVAALEPQRERIAAVDGALRAVLAHASDGRHAPAATILAVVAWWSGDGASANDWLGQALGADEAYSFALLLANAVDAGLPPGWARRAAARDAALR